MCVVCVFRMFIFIQVYSIYCTSESVFNSYIYHMPHIEDYIM